ncbi:hypothetical protein [Leptolyngbya sp. FACHB-261]|uniref:hypothetical protein n=1 Tax=Leptolyngbya sp. FACHB-261 TaxID=2692806 RepID=UPI00168687C1|nr:hypothetical protein [Leptolyngbya sp. FACHB-261]MBD2101401.1 hypothetical protein [Leptolyngbya sp. FACHB-261]
MEEQLWFAKHVRAQVLRREAKPRYTPSLITLWARRYVDSLRRHSTFTELHRPALVASAPADRIPDSLRVQTTQKVAVILPLVAGRALALTHNLLDESLQQQQIDPRHLDPLQIAVKNRRLFQMVLDLFTAGRSPDQLSTQASREFGRVRQRYTQHDGRVLGFVGMHVHYTIVGLLQQLTLMEQACFEPYLQVMNDHMYLPLQACYEAAAEHESSSAALRAVHTLLPVSSEIAYLVFAQTCRQFPGYCSNGGSLLEPAVQQSSIRDVELFQTYLCQCVLEASFRPVQKELLPLCLLLYPRLGVSSKLVRTMLQHLEFNMSRLVPAQQMALFRPYLMNMHKLFSATTFEETPRTSCNKASANKSMSMNPPVAAWLSNNKRGSSHSKPVAKCNGNRDFSDQNYAVIFDKP